MKKNAFTLIELLAVIVILAIIALIAVPIVLGIINDSKISSEKENINLYKSAVNNAIARKQLSEISFNPDTCNVKDNGDLECFVNNKAIGIIKVEMSGQLPNDGIIRFENNKISEIEDLKIKVLTTMSLDTPQVCPKCGTQNQGGVAFCANCGTSMKKSE